MPRAGAGRVGSAHVWFQRTGACRRAAQFGVQIDHYAPRRWSQELANLRQEIADPLVPVHPDLPGLATRHTPSNDQDAHEDQHRIMRCWNANAPGLRAKVERQLARDRSAMGSRFAGTWAIRLWTLLTVLCASVAGTSVRRGTCSPCPSFIMASLMAHSQCHTSQQPTSTPWRPPPVQLLFYLVRHLLDEPERFPNLSVVGVTSGHGARPGFGGPCKRWLSRVLSLPGAGSCRRSPRTGL